MPIGADADLTTLAHGAAADVLGEGSGVLIAILIAMGFMWDCCGIAMGLRWDCYGSAMGVLWDCGGAAMGLARYCVVTMQTDPTNGRGGAGVLRGAGDARYAPHQEDHLP